jgi:hypothetical protein
LRAHEFDSGKTIVDVDCFVFGGIRGTSGVVEDMGVENEVQDVAVILAAETAMFVNFSSPFE